MDSYLFPFNTCEKISTNSIVAQPYSALVNMCTCFLLYCFLVRANHPNYYLVLSILTFELFHTFSHIKHINNNIQTNIIHFMTYSMNICFLYALYKKTALQPNYKFLCFLFVLVVFDICSFLWYPLIYYITTQMSILISILVYYYSYIPEKYIIHIISFSVLIVMLLINENDADVDIVCELLVADKIQKIYTFSFYIPIKWI